MGHATIGNILYRYGHPMPGKYDGAAEMPDAARGLRNRTTPELSADG